MKNEYGVELNKAGYAPSIMQTEYQGICECYLCGRRSSDYQQRFLDKKIDRHEVFGGADREKCKALGMWVHLCHLGCHEGPGSVHEDRQLDKQLKAEAQQRAMEEYGWTEQEFIDRFGKNFLEYLPKPKPAAYRNVRGTGAAAPASYGGFRVLADPDMPY